MKTTSNKPEPRFDIENMISAYLVRDRWQNEVEYNPNMMSELETMTEQESNLQIKQFLSEVERVFTERYEIKTTFNDEALPTDVKILTRETLDLEQLGLLDSICEGYQLKCTFNGTDRGRLSINLKQFEQ